MIQIQGTREKIQRYLQGVDLRLTQQNAVVQDSDGRKRYSIDTEEIISLERRVNGNVQVQITIRKNDKSVRGDKTYSLSHMLVDMLEYHGLLELEETHYPDTEDKNYVLISTD